MITYNWKAEFDQSELLIIKLSRQVEAEESLRKTAHVIREMANALDRYEAILNEMETKLDWDETDEEGRNYH